MRKHLCLAAFVGFACAAAASAGTASESRYGATIVTGFQSNPLRLAADDPGGIFTQLHLDGFYRYEINHQLEFYVDGGIRGRLHESAVSDADWGAGQVESGFVIKPATPALDRLTVVAGGRYDVYRATFVDRETGRVFEVDADPDPAPPSTVAIGDRLDNDSLGAYLNLLWAQNRSLQLFLESSFESRKYVADYSTTTTLDPLDHDSLTFVPGVSWQISGIARLTASVGFTDLDYDAQPALDESGSRVPGTTRAYHYARYKITLLLTPASRWKVWFGADEAERDDRYAGYYDYGAFTSYVAADRALGQAGRLRLYGSLYDLEYDSATITGDPEDRTRDSVVRRAVARYEQRVGPGLRWFVETGVQRTDSRDPVFAYDSDWLLGGIRFFR